MAAPTWVQPRDGSRLVTVHRSDGEAVRGVRLGERLVLATDGVYTRHDSFWNTLTGVMLAYLLFFVGCVLTAAGCCGLFEAIGTIK